LSIKCFLNHNDTQRIKFTIVYDKYKQQMLTFEKLGYLAYTLCWKKKNIILEISKLYLIQFPLTVNWLNISDLIWILQSITFGCVSDTHSCFSLENLLLSHKCCHLLDIRIIFLYSFFGKLCKKCIRCNAMTHIYIVFAKAFGIVESLKL